MIYKQTFDPANVVTDYFVDGATGDLAEGITLEETATPDGLAHQLSFVSDGNIGSAEFVVTGTDADGVTISETVTGVTTSPVETANYYQAVESIVSEDDISTAVLDVGFVDEFVSPTIRLDWRRNVPSRWFLDVTGTINVSVDFAIEEPALAGHQHAVKWANPNSSLEAETTDSTAFQEVGSGYTAARLRVASYSSGAAVTLRGVQPEVV